MARRRARAGDYWAAAATHFAAGVLGLPPVLAGPGPGEKTPQSKKKRKQQGNRVRRLRSMPKKIS